jgi:hypothetical protein
MSDLAKVEKGDFKGEVKFEKGVIKIVAGVGTKGLTADLAVGVPVDYFLDKLAESIPGQIDDSVIALLKAALKA